MAHAARAVASVKCAYHCVNSRNNALAIAYQHGGYAAHNRHYTSERWRRRHAADMVALSAQNTPSPRFNPQKLLSVSRDKRILFRRLFGRA